MAWAHVWNARDCILELAWRSAAQVRRLKPLTLAATLACGPGAGPPPPVAHVPPVLTPPTWVPPVMPPPWSYVPPDTSYPPMLIPTGPVVPLPNGPQETEMPRSSRDVEEARTGGGSWDVGPPPLPPICDTVPTQPGVTTSPVPEPAPLLFLGMGLAVLGLLRYARPVEPSVKTTILWMEDK